MELRPGARPQQAPSRSSGNSPTDAVWITVLGTGPGLRLAVKDLFDTAGVRTTYGSAVFADHVPGATAEAVGLLEASGW